MVFKTQNSMILLGICSFAASALVVESLKSTLEMAPQTATSTAAPAAPTQFIPGPPPIKLDPVAVDYGFLAPGESRKAVVSMTNAGSHPLTIVAIQPTCSCTTTTNLTGRIMEPGQLLQFDVEMGASVVPGPRHATVKILAEGFGRALEMDVKGEVALPLRAVPSFINPPPTGPAKGRLVLESIDRAPFRVISSHGMPPVFLGFDPAKDETKATYVLRYDLSSLPQQSWPPFWLIETDRKDCPVIGLKVRDDRFAIAPVLKMREYALNLGILYAGQPKDIAVDIMEPTDQGVAVKGSESLAAQVLGSAPLEDGSRIMIRVTPSASAVGPLVAPLQISIGSRSQPLHAFGVVHPAVAPAEGATPPPSEPSR